MDDRQKIRFLEERLAQANRERMEAITALEMALDLHRYLPTLDEGTNAESLLEEASPRIRAVLPFRAFAFYLVGEGFPSFDRIYCDPVSWSAFVEREKTLLVEDGSFSWAIDRRKVVVVTSSGREEKILLHVLATPSRVLGMFLGVLDPKTEIPDVSLIFLSVVLNSVASLIQNLQLFRLVQGLNGELVERVFALERSGRDLQRERRELQGKAQAAEEDLDHANRTLLQEMAQRRRVEEALRSQEEQIRALFESSPDSIVVLGRDGTCLYANGAFLERTGSSEERVRGQGLEELLSETPDQVPFWREALDEVFASGRTVRRETRMVFHGRAVCLESTLSPIRGKGDEVCAVGVIWRDVTERRLAEERIRFLSYHDPLTGLYNRRYFEEELVRVDTPRQLPMSLLIGDVDGLKLTNDAFGHQEGDRLLVDAAERIRKVLRGEDILARWGGDEFVVVLPRTDAATARAVAERISRYDEARIPIPCRITFGAATKDREDQDLGQVLREAEDRMYARKLLEREGVRRQILSALMDRLRRSTFESEAHTEGVGGAARRVGELLLLPQEEMRWLELLCCYHDVGMIDLPEAVLRKPGPLDAGEWEMVRKHPELGYRIALSSSSDLAPVAETILCHHERFDGTGYPQGRRGEEIPLLSRILAIADSYEVLTSGRPYRPALSPRKAREEILRGAGSRYDPELVRLFLSEP